MIKRYELASNLLELSCNLQGTCMYTLLSVNLPTCIGTTLVSQHHQYEQHLLDSI